MAAQIAVRVMPSKHPPGAAKSETPDLTRRRGGVPKTRQRGRMTPPMALLYWGGVGRMGRHRGAGRQPRQLLGGCPPPSTSSKIVRKFTSWGIDPSGHTTTPGMAPLLPNPQGDQMKPPEEPRHTGWPSRIAWYGYLEVSAPKTPKSR